MQGPNNRVVLSGDGPHPPAGAPALVELVDVEKHFGDVHALGPVSVSVAVGEIVSIVGPSGCGKSTLLEIVGGLQSAEVGAVRVAGADVRGPRDRTAIIFQDSATFPWRTVQDNVAFGLEVRGVKRAERRAVARELLSKVGLSKFADSYPSQLSGGMRQRVAMARALSLDPDLILADEPFGALDEQTRVMMAFELLRVVEKLSAGVLLITHSIQEAVLMSDRVLVMGARPGRIIDEVVLSVPRPRTEHALGLPESAAAIERIWTSIRSEVVRAAEEAEDA